MGQAINATREQKETALEFAAIHGFRAAGRQLGVTHKTVMRWAEQLPEFWSNLKAGDRETQKQGFAARLEDLAEGYSAAEVEALDRALKLIPTADAKELAGLIKAMGSSRGLAVVNSRALRGEDADRLDVTINFGQLENAMEAVLAQAQQPAIQVENEA
jgi:hypothetical protein